MSRFIQDLLNFCFGPWGGGRWVGGIWGHLGEWECHHMHAHACKCMYRNCKWPPTWRHPCLSCLTCMCMYVCMHVCMGYPSTHPYPSQPSSTHPPPPIGNPRNWSKFNKSCTNQDISILFEDLKSVENSPHMGGCMIWWVGGWVDAWDQVKSLKFNKC